MEYLIPFAHVYFTPFPQRLYQMSHSNECYRAAAISLIKAQQYFWTANTIAITALGISRSSYFSYATFFICGVLYVRSFNKFFHLSTLWRTSKL